MKNPRSILITGGSSGIGEALVYAYAGSGISIAISGRDASRLESVAAQARLQGAVVHPRVIDVTARAAMRSWIVETDEAAPLDLVIANAGIGLGSHQAPSLADIAELTFATNVQGVFNTVHPALERMVERRSGQIAIMSSVAGLLGMPGVAPYAASKAAVRSYGEGLRGAYHRHNVEVNVICPGFVESRLTAGNKFRMPFLMDAQRAAHIVVKGLAGNKARIAFPWQTYGAMRFLQMLPTALSGWLLRRSPGK